MDQREKDIQALCTAVLNASPKHYDNPNGGYETTCPFCWAMDIRGGGLNEMWAEMSDLPHKTDCAYHIAKDLSTNMD